MAEIDNGPVCRVAVHIELLRIRTASQIEDVPDADLWAMDRETQHFDEGKALTDNALTGYAGCRGYAGRCRSTRASPARSLAVTQANIKAQEQTLFLTRDRVQAGLATELDVTRARAQVATTRAEVPNLTSAIKSAVHRLSVLVGVSPGELAGPWLEARPVTAGPPEVPAGVPSDLLRRRPDIRRAERELAAATARIGVATADLFPRFSLTGAIGLQSVAASDFFTGGSRFFALGPAIHSTMFVVVCKSHSE